MLQELIDLINEFSATGLEITVEEDGQINVHSYMDESSDKDYSFTKECLKNTLQTFVAKYSKGVSK